MSSDRVSVSAEFGALKAISATVGRDPDQIQAGGGNTSLKEGDRLIVKASGKWLASALTDEVFVSLSLAEIRGFLQTGTPTDQAFRPATFDLLGQPTALRPSIETAFHALLPDPVVLHTHSTSAIAHAVLANGPVHVADALAGLPWAWVPYVKPGVALALEVAKIAREQGAKILLLANHGVIVTGATVQEAADRLQTVEIRLHRGPAGKQAGRDQARLLQVAADLGDHYEPAAEDSWHVLGTDPQAFQVVAGGTLYPDHVVFLGPSVWTLAAGQQAPAALRNVSALANPGVKPVVVVENAGCLVRRELGEAPRALLHCLMSVARKVRKGEPIRYLSPEDEAVLLNWDAEHYRQKLGRS